MSLKPWREGAVPHEDVLKGTFQQAEFAADISRVHDKTASSEYQDSVLFFKRTFITEGMRLLLDSVIKRLTGKGGDPVIQLQTAFGGGKTHTMLAVYHLALGGVNARQLAGMAPILDAAGVKDLPKTKIVVLDGIKLSPNQPIKRGNIMVHTMWGELAWQLGGDEAYALVKDADISGTSPGKDVLAKLIGSHAPCVILVDELVAYIRQFEEGRSFTGGTFDSNLSFIQALTEALKAVPTAVLLASLPESDKETGSHRGQMALQTLSHYFARVQALWKPVATDEAFEIVRRRLFVSIDTKVAAETCRAYVDYYIANSSSLPQETQEAHYYDRMVNAYPIHPEIFERLYEDWSSLDNFQRTRGVLKLMAKVIHKLWNDNNKDLLIQPGNIPLYDTDVRNEAICYLPQGWDPVLEGDIDGDRAETADVEKDDPRLGSVQACRRSARTVFLGSAPSNAIQRVRGLTMGRVILGAAQPGQQPSLYSDALKRLIERLHYLNFANDRFWFDTRANLRREMEERKKRYQNNEEVFSEIRSSIQRLLSGAVFGGVHIFAQSSDIPDDSSLRLVVLSPDAAYIRNQSGAQEKAMEILKNRGDQPRQRQNRLIFLAADNDCVLRLKDQVKTMLAWESIVQDVREMRLNLDQFQSRQASQCLEDAQQTISRMVRETYKWLLAPMQEDKNGKGISDIQWEPFPLNSSAPGMSVEIARVLKENEILIMEWAPIHLSNLLKRWFWKSEIKDAGALDVWNKMSCYLYMPRLKDEEVFRNAMAAGSTSRDFFGFAYGKDNGKYVGLVYAKSTVPLLDSALLVIEPSVAAAQAEIPVPGTQAQPVGSKVTPGPQSTTASPGILKNLFFGSVDLDPLTVKYDFVRLADEVLQHFSVRPDTKIRITVDIQAESTVGYDQNIQRTIKENCNVLQFKNAEFEKKQND